MRPRRSSDGVLLSNIPPGGFYEKLELIRPQQRVVAQLDGEARTLLELLQEVLFVLQQMHRHVGVDPNDERILSPLEHHAAKRALDTARDRLGCEHAAGTVAGRTGV